MAPSYVVFSGGIEPWDRMHRSLQRIVSAADLLRPSTFFRTLARVDQLADRTRDLTAAVEALQVRTEQLLTIYQSDAEHRDDLLRLDELLDRSRIAGHVASAIAAAPLHHDPCPHIVVDNWLPADVYRTMVAALPAAVFFADRENRRQQLPVPFPLAPAFSQAVWRIVAQDIVGGVLSDALNQKFRPEVRRYIGTFCPAFRDDAALDLHASDGRVLLRRPGYVIDPHRDPKWGFITGLIYLARDGDNEAYGTQLYRVRDDGEAPNANPFYVPPSQCELVKAVPYKPNTLLAFVNSTGAHGASIPADAKPRNLERYVYQFRLGPDSRAIKQLLALMPEDRRAVWAGTKTEKAAATY
jgi:hypothetical protein